MFMTPIPFFKRGQGPERGHYFVPTDAIFRKIWQQFMHISQIVKEYHILIADSVQITEGVHPPGLKGRFNRG